MSKHGHGKGATLIRLFGDACIFYEFFFSGVVSFQFSAGAGGERTGAFSCNKTAIKYEGGKCDETWTRR